MLCKLWFSLVNTFPWNISCNPCGSYSRGTKQALSPPSCKWEIIGLANGWQTRNETLSLLFPKPGFSSLTPLFSLILSSEWGTQEKVLPLIENLSSFAQAGRWGGLVQKQEDLLNWGMKVSPKWGEVIAPLDPRNHSYTPYFRGTSSSCILGLSLSMAQENVPT